MAASRSGRGRRHRCTEPFPGRAVPQRLRGRGQSRGGFGGAGGGQSRSSVLDWTPIVGERSGGTLMALARAGPPRSGGGLFAWWLGELRELLPPRWRASGREAAVRCCCSSSARSCGCTSGAAGGWCRSAACCCRISNSARRPVRRCDRAAAAPGARPASRCGRPRAGRGGRADLPRRAARLGRERSRQDHGAQARPAHALVGRAGLCRAEGDGAGATACWRCCWPLRHERTSTASCASSPPSA